MAAHRTCEKHEGCLVVYDRNVTHECPVCDLELDTKVPEALGDITLADVVELLRESGRLE